MKRSEVLFLMVLFAAILGACWFIAPYVQTREQYERAKLRELRAKYPNH